MESLVIYFVLLLAIAFGWVLGRLTAGNKKVQILETKDIFQDYFVGLNYLLNDEPDEAIDTFIKALEINSETFETHLALGALLRRRGKVDKAIKVHQTLLARPGLERNISDSTRLQLAVDYIYAGLLDRAEGLLNDILTEDSPAKWDALRHLITIYQTEKEWEKAIECSTILLRNSSYKKETELKSAAAHYCCESAEKFLKEKQKNKAREQIKRALIFDENNVRASLFFAQIEQLDGNFKSAIKHLTKVRTNNPEFVCQVLEPLAECYEQLQNMSEYERLLSTSLPDETDVSVVLALSELVKKRAGNEAAIEFLNNYLTKKPSLTGLVELLRLQIPKADAEVGNNLSLLQETVDQVLRKKPAYQCNHCGYESRNLYWLCPSCKKWDKIKPIMEVGSF